MGCMCESLRPGITVRRFASITVVAGPRRRKMSRALPVAVIFPSVIARASTNDGRLFVAILAFCNIVSAGIEFPGANRSFTFFLTRGQADCCPLVFFYLCAPARADGI